MAQSILLAVHITAAIAGLLSGYAALFFAKGARWHRSIGNVFFCSMLVMSGSGASLATFLKPNLGNALVGVLTFYLVATGWAAAARKAGRPGLLEGASLLVALASGIGFAIGGSEAVNSASGLKDGYPAGVYFVFGAVALFSAALDVRMFLGGGVSGGRRIARHLWRMCFALLIAAASFFLGKQQHFPAAIRHSPYLGLPVLLVAVVMIFWLVRVRRKRTPRESSASTVPPAVARSKAIPAPRAGIFS